MYKVSPDAFFVKKLLVPPSRFRPPRVVNDAIMLHAQTALFMKILSTSEAIAEKANANESVTALWLELQGHVNLLMDDTKGEKKASADAEAVGIRQLIEKKEGLVVFFVMCNAP